MKKITICLCMMILVYPTASFAKKLSKEEIKNIILQTTRHSKKYKYNSHNNKKRVNTKKVNTQKSKVQRVAKSVSQKPQQNIKKPNTPKLLPFVLPVNYSSQQITLNQKGFKLIKGEKTQRKKRKKNPLFNL